MESELELIELQIAELLQKQAELTSRKNALLQQLEEACDAASSSSSKSAAAVPVMNKQELQRYDGTGIYTYLHAYMHIYMESIHFDVYMFCVDFPWSKEVEQHLKDSFHLSKFRPLQLRAINLTLSDKDLFLVMPTGRGKSLCYQLPAVCSKGTLRHKLFELNFRLPIPILQFYSFLHTDSSYCCLSMCVSGFTLVITPLVSLMEDQIMYLKSIGVSAVMLNASSSKVGTDSPAHISVFSVERTPQGLVNLLFQLFMSNCCFLFK